MTRTTVAAIDLGATSGRVIVGVFSPSAGLQLTEVHRFPNSFHQLGENFYWDVGGLFTEIKKGLREAKKLFPELISCGIDVWGCDVAFLNKSGRLVFPVHAYRDTRTEPLLARIKAAGDDQKLYEWTGLPAINYNTGLQLRETVEACPELVQLADRCLWLPDYFNYLLSGTMVNEFSIASTAMMLDLHSEGYSKEAFNYFKIPAKWFAGPHKAGQKLGKIKDIDGLGEIEVVLVPGHDTSCAFEAIPRTGSDLIISSGTWMLAGAMLDKPASGDAAWKLGISNERCGDGSYRPLKILIGLWLLEQMLATFSERPKNEAEWGALIQAAEDQPAPSVLLDTEDRARLFNPKNMREAIDDQLLSRGATPPDSIAGYVRLICDSLGQTVATAAKKFEAITETHFENIVIVGGGAKNRLLCQRIADYSRLPVYSYNLEATSVGNMGYQLVAQGVVPSMAAFHESILGGLNKKVYLPE
ncbi:MAG: FGGY family carbohydrate kinase [Verrucomicrobiota bacterium]|nr:FGGY family carbohydrate kinase [Verrucomicrobiota bacterium]